jgi:hypothetical protein
MYWKLSGIVTLGLVACGGVATAGDVMLGQSGSVELLAKAGTSLTCYQINCSNSARFSYFLESISSAESDAAWLNSSAIGSRFSTLLTPSRMFGSTMSYGLSDIGVTPAATAAPSPSPAASPSDGPDYSGTFVLSNGQVLMQQPASTLTDDSTNSAGTYATDLPFSNPIVSPAFNLAATTIVVNPPSSQPAFTDAPAAPAGAAPVAADTVVAGPGPLPTPSTSNTEAIMNADVTDPETAVDGSGGGSAFAAMGAGTSSMSTPEPATDLLIGGGLIAAGIFARVKRQQRNR